MIRFHPFRTVAAGAALALWIAATAQDGDQKRNPLNGLD